MQNRRRFSNSDPRFHCVWASNYPVRLITARHTMADGTKSVRLRRDRPTKRRRHPKETILAVMSCPIHYLNVLLYIFCTLCAYIWICVCVCIIYLSSTYYNYPNPIWLYKFNFSFIRHTLFGSRNMFDKFQAEFFPMPLECWYNSNIEVVLILRHMREREGEQRTIKLSISIIL